jgi:hypothetical protein
LHEKFEQAKLGGPRCTCRPFRVTRWDSRSSSMSPTVSTEAMRSGLVRLRMARTRAMSSGRENGLTT